MRNAAWLSTVLALVLTTGATGAQQLRVEPDQQYLVLEVTKLSTFETELKAAAQLGFRLSMSTTSDEGARIQALLERAAVPPDTFDYRLVATFSKKTGDKEMNAAGADGYRVVPHTAMVKKGFTIFNVDNVVVMERKPKAAERFEYRAIDAVRTSTFHKELKAAVDAGWKVIDMTYGYIILERLKSAS